ncbi:MAG: SDR family NAD(P)-dependent oxidoreductase [Humidesulfovibrio sp.]|uniref:SDR family NAD(P)-dependent oxidoreductase n=1 Tax=Humidesulfovibrio sp. TaxID=2910988 RepID=UPI0027EE1B5E|nr:SDR family NAD(P)-dependent oxidoreductase [Humidesulfovibrio sp.]MDQ7835574.1 SDR family NAD(P)-dependent oxidoreductase [Humidesulfovibrio sp.]
MTSSTSRTMRKALITGGAGFIGSHLADVLVAAGVEVVAVDNMANGRQENLANAMATGLCAFIQADITDFMVIAPHFEGADTVFHLAGLADIVPSVENPRPYLHANVDGTVNVLEAARRAGAERLVYAASSSCYGIPDAFPTSEAAELRPQYPYALSKRLGEDCVLHWGRVYGLEVNSLRLFNVYGPRAQTHGAYGGVFKVFLPQKLAGEPFTIVGDGTQVRDFVHVRDVARAFVLAATCSAHGEVFNVGSGEPQSVNRLADLLGGERVHLPRRPGEPDATWADIGKIRAQFGWRPEIGFEAGVGEMLARIEDYRAATLWDAEGIEQATRAWFDNLGRKA